ncbi:hypothetical protein [Nocardia tengchongensis]|uniref:hypothetical protein n=1 Tax=Nocardia tengchongensis TaxID=2055889 RepID=UPI0036BBDBE9
MADMLRADITALRIMAAGIRGEAAAISGIDPVDLIAKVGLAMPNSAIGAAAVTIGEPLLASLRRMGEHLHSFADTSERCATTYEGTQLALAAELDGYLHTAS